MIFDGAEEEWDRAGKTRGIKGDKTRKLSIPKKVRAGGLEETG